jgi:hypothetical protein
VTIVTMELKWTDSTVRTGGIASGPIFERSCRVDFQYWSSLESRQRFWVVEWGEMIWRLAALLQSVCVVVQLSVVNNCRAQSALSTGQLQPKALLLSARPWTCLSSEAIAYSSTQRTVLSPREILIGSKATVLLVNVTAAVDMKAAAINYSMRCKRHGMRQPDTETPAPQKEILLHEHQWTISRVLSAW